jgi:protein dithiol oxidoreductase (disulfide-forming)
MLRRTFLAAALMAASFAGSLTAFAQNTPQAGREYMVLNTPQNTETGDKLEVIEFFWYRCPHCYSLEPSLEAWVKKLPADTQFRRVPAVFNEEWALDARVFFALEAMGELDRLHRPLFDAIHRQGGISQKGQAYTKWVQNWLASQKVDPNKFDAAMRSFSVDSKIKRATQVAQAWRLDGVPALAVNGRYIVSASMVGDQRVMLGVTDHLLQQSRQQRSAKK